jgi:hypothetical protein
MATRTFKFFGKAYTTGSTPSVTLEFNNQVVYTGNIPATTGVTPGKNGEDLIEMFTFTADTSVTGSIPIEMSVVGGDLFWGIFTANYAGNIVEIDPNNPGSDPKNPNTIIVTPTVDVYGPVFFPTPESDGRNNVKIDGVDAPPRVVLNPAESGTWQYLVRNGSVLTCTQEVDGAIVQL